MIEGVFIKPLKVFSDERGKVMHMLRCDANFFRQFGEVYFSSVTPGFVKAWKKHSKMTQHFAVPAGKIRLVIYDIRKDSESYNKIEVIEIGEGNYCLVRIPSLVWYGFKGISSIPALVANCTDIPHDPAETEHLEQSDKRIPYNWSS